MNTDRFVNRKVRVVNPEPENTRFKGLVGIAQYRGGTEPVEGGMTAEKITFYQIELGEGPGAEDSVNTVFVASELEFVD